jgi:hypothetical protein
LKKGSKAAKAWGAKMRRLRGTKKRKKSTRKGGVRKSKLQIRKRKTKRKSTRKGGVRKTARRAYTGLKRRVSRRKKSDSAWNF